ncbi:MAG: hypothetical protein Pars93KO_19710 [Parasphingorhabdus sp.]
MLLYALLQHLAKLLPKADDPAKQHVQIEEALHWLYADTCRDHGLTITQAHETDEWEAKLLEPLLG